MIKYLKIKNFFSFQDEVEINFESSNYGDKKNNVFNISKGTQKTTLMKSIVIYGANASGKSNILKALVTIRNFVTRQPLFVSAFLLNENSRNLPIFFEICFFVDNKEFLYNFELLPTSVKSENLYEIKNTKKVPLIIRDFQDIKFLNEFENYSNQLEEKVGIQVSALWILDQFNAKLNNKSILHFFRNLNSLGGLFDGIKTVDLLKLKENKENRNFIIEFLKCADIDICDIKIEETIGDTFEFNFESNDFKSYKSPNTTISFGHKVHGTEKIEYFPLGVESEGTQKLFGIIGMILITIQNEGILCFDEIENNLHPHIIKNLLSLIHSDLGKNYQFILTTHSLELMNLKEFKKEQIGITEKNRDGGTKFYTLYDFDDLRSENDIRKMYDLGFLGGIPQTKDFSILFKEVALGENPNVFI